MIVGISGPSGCGKSLVADLFVKRGWNYYNMNSVAIEIASEVFELPTSAFDDSPEQFAGTLHLSFSEYSQILDLVDDRVSFIRKPKRPTIWPRFDSTRALLKYIRTDFFEASVPDPWVYMLDLPFKAKPLVIEDVLPHEFGDIRIYGGKIIGVSRPGIANPCDTALYDYHLINGTDVSSFVNSTSFMLPSVIRELLRPEV